MSKFFGKLRNDSQKLYGKIRGDAQKLYGKIRQNAPSVLNGISSGLSYGSRLADKIASNPLTVGIASAIGAPELVAGLKAGGKILGAGANLTNYNSYRGDANQVGKNILERSKNLGKSLGIEFH